jgi:hypothetical protein
VEQLQLEVLAHKQPAEQNTLVARVRSKQPQAADMPERSHN